VEAPLTLGARFVHALVEKDAGGMLELLHPEIEFRGLTPGRSWEAGDADAVIAIFLETWFEPADQIQALEQLDCDGFADRERVGYRLTVSNPDGRFLVEQQAYLAARDGQIGWMRVLCSGYRPCLH
jgi:hypothetical protein